MAQKQSDHRMNRLAKRFGGLQKTRVIIAGIALALVVGIFGTFVACGGISTSQDLVIERSGDEQEAPKNESETPPDQPEVRIVVHVDGAVEHPGVYELVGTVLRMRDAVDAAGGLLEDAETSTLNLASQISDGTKIHVPAQGELQDTGRAGAANAAAEPYAPSSSGLVNINTASASELQGLSGIGEATANAIIRERERGGLFASAEDIMRVTGIGEKKFQKIKDSICV